MGGGGRGREDRERERLRWEEGEDYREGEEEEREEKRRETGEDVQPVPSCSGYPERAARRIHSGCPVQLSLREVSVPLSLVCKHARDLWDWER